MLSTKRVVLHFLTKGLLRNNLVLLQAEGLKSTDMVLLRASGDVCDIVDSTLGLVSTVMEATSSQICLCGDSASR